MGRSDILVTCDCGTTFERKLSEGWKTKCLSCWVQAKQVEKRAAYFESGKPLMSAPVRVVGVNYVPSCGQCEVPPWEVCACSALMSRPTPGTSATTTGSNHGDEFWDALCRNWMTSRPHKPRRGKGRKATEPEDTQA